MTFNENNINRRRNGQFGEKNLTDPGQMDLGDGVEIPGHLLRQARRINPDATDAELNAIAQDLQDAERELIGYTDKEPGEGHYTGSKYQGRYIPTKEVSAHVRKDIKEAQKRGLLDPDMEFSVRTYHDEVVITPKGDPERFWRVGWKRGEPQWVHTQEAEDIETTLLAISNAYNMDDSDITRDYFHTNHATGVVFLTEYDLAWDAREKSRTPETTEAVRIASERRSREWLAANWNGICE